MKTSNKLLLGLYTLILIGILSFAIAARIGIDKNAIKGNGKNSSETRNVQGFDKINIKGRMTVYLTPGNNTQLKINADENLIPLVESTIDGGELKIKLKNKVGRGDIIKLYLTAQTLNELEIRNHTNLESTSEFSGESLKVLASEGAKGKLKLKYKELFSEVHAGADLTLLGVANIATIMFSSGASVHANDIAISKCKIDGSSGGSARIGTIEELDASASSGASIRYSGNPKITNIDYNSGGSIGKR